MRPWFYATACLIAATGCTKPAERPEGGTAGGDAVAPGSPRPAGNEGLVQGSNAFVMQSLTVRKEPSDVKEVDDPSAKKKKAPNWVANIYRGEQVTPLETKAEWAHIRLSDGKEGWVKADAVLTGAVETATVFEKTKVFTRPDLLALNPSRQIEAGSLLFVLRSKDQFSEVNSGGTQTVWVLNDVLSKDAKEVEAAKLINRGRALKERNDIEAEGPFSLAKSQFGDTKLVQLLLLPPPPAADPNNPNAPAAPAPSPTAASPEPPSPVPAPPAAPPPAGN